MSMVRLTEKMVAINLLPCPFCDSAAQWFRDGRQVGVECSQQEDCPGRCQTDVYDEQNAEHAAGRWNDERAAAPAAPAQEPVASTAEEKLQRAGVFVGMSGLRGLAEADEFWEGQMYGTRFYYGPGGGQYLHRSVLRSAIQILDAAPAPAVAAQDELPQAARDVLAERKRQVSVEGWTPEHDDQHASGELACAAACYAVGGDAEPPPMWPWDADWWKPTSQRRMLVKAGALILAEIERLDRAALAGRGK
jgi:hypothetical protein